MANRKRGGVVSSGLKSVYGLGEKTRADQMEKIGYDDPDSIGGGDVKSTPWDGKTVSVPPPDYGKDQSDD